MPELTFKLNGQPTTVPYREGMHFLEVLREECGIVSPKDGCAPQGVCGCCTVIVNGKPVLACKRTPAQMADADVVTLEGIPEQHREALAGAFERDGAVQCGYCIPGIVARASPLLARGEAVDRETVVKALPGHLCRCTGYHRIIDAVQTACEVNAGVTLAPEPRRREFFGESLGLHRSTTTTRPDGVGAATGKLRGHDHALGAKDYVGDITLPGMLHGAVVLSRHARARVRQIDTERAAAAAGVARVLTATDVPGERFVGLLKRDWPVFVAEGELTRCVGDVLALVVADSQFGARKAAELISVEYEVLTPVTDPEAALDPAAPAVHEPGNLLEVCEFSRGDVESALADSAHVVEAEYVTQRIEHAFMEPEACLATPAGEGLKVYSQGQGVHDDQKQIAEILGVAPESVDVELVTNGGAFGGKEDLSIQGHTALAAIILQRPVRTVLTRDQSIRMHPKRHPITLRYAVGADAEGRLTAVRARIVGDTGAYASVGTKVLERAAGHCCGPYRVPNVDVEAKTVYTNNPPCGAMRGFGANQASFAIEGIMDILAERVGIDGYDIRDRNILGPGDQFATGQVMTESCGIRQTLEAVRDVYRSARYAGIGCGIKNTGIGNGMDDTGRVQIRVLEGNRIEIVTGYTEMGQGLHTILCQVVAEEAGVDPAAMSVRTDSSPEVVCGMTTASRATSLCTAAGQIAARKLAADLAGATLGELTGKTYLGEFVCDITTKPGAAVEHPRTHMTFGYATQVVILDDRGRLERVVAAHDVGRAINPLNCAGQIEGAVHMGLGYALTEDLPCTDGMPDSTDMMDLGVLRAKATPPIDVILIEVPDEIGGYGSKGVGEIGLVPTAGAVAGALYAFDGERRFELPMIDSSAAKGLVPKSSKARVLSLSPLPFPELLRRMRDELRVSDAIFDLPFRKWFVPDPEYDYSAVHFGRKASTPVGPAAGPHTQLAQNIVLSWLGGARIIELKTVQVNDELEIPRPCIHVPNVGLNVEWSQELRVEQSLQEYAKALYLIEVLKQTRCFGRLESDIGMDTVFDISVGYDLAGIKSEKVTGFLTGMLDPAALWDGLRGQLDGDLSEFKDLSLPGRISDCVTLSTFHGCPANEIESITKYLIAEMGFNAIVKLNPTLLGFERVRELLYDVLGYEEFALSPDAFAADLHYGDALAILRNLKSVAEAHDSTIGAKFTNTLVVANDPKVFPTQPDPYMYVSGPPLHVIAMNLMQRVRNDLEFEFPVSFSAGIDAKNFPGAVACGMVPITTCTDLLRQGGYGRLPAYLSSLKRDMDRLGVKSREAFVLAVGGNAVAAITTALADAGSHELGPGASRRLVEAAGSDPDGLPGFVRELAAAADLDGEAVALQASRIAGRLNGNATIPALGKNPRYHRSKNTKEPRTVESILDRYDCLNCDLCIVVCPNDAFFAYEVDPAAAGVGEAHQLALVDEWCNECSNCEVYCPETGAPFRVKERVFATAQNFARSTADGFFLDGQSLQGRIDGDVFEMTVAAGSDPTSDREIPAPIRIRFNTAYNSIYRSAAPNPVNPNPAART